MTHDTASARKKKPRRAHGRARDGVEKPAVTDPNSTTSPTGQILKPKKPHGRSKPRKG
jgi:hypothetical protein